MIKKFKPNDIVRLKSKGPEMTVIDYRIDSSHSVIGYFKGDKNIPIDETDIVRCVWFDGNVRKEGDFHEGALELVPMK